jgi:predicted protein tyrosine phosphatase
MKLMKIITTGLYFGGGYNRGANIFRWVNISGMIGESAPHHIWGDNSLKRANILFICGKNRERSATAEEIFAGRLDLEVRSAGLDNDADHQCTTEDVEWANLIFIMESSHRAKLSRKFKGQLKNARIICLNIQNKYEFMDSKLIGLLQTRVNPHLSSSRPTRSHSRRHSVKPPFSIA